MQSISSDKLVKHLHEIQTRDLRSLEFEGYLTKIVGLALEVKGCKGAVGSRFLIKSSETDESEAELVGFDNETSYLLPLDYSQGLVPGARVLPLSQKSSINVGDNLLGRVVDARIRPLDSKGSLFCDTQYPLYGTRINPLERDLVISPLDVGVRSINGLLTIGKGQRIGLFAGTGVGKSMLLRMIAKATEADVVVVALVGERGREVREFVDKIITPETSGKTIVVASPADDPPLLRLQGALSAASISEYFRDQGKDVLLIMDSLTRFAQAQREIALSVGEPPANQGYPPSVFTKLPSLVERAGCLKRGGSVTGIYTVLTEGDDLNDPIADAARGILDGHIVLERQLSEAGIYPAISIASSLSRIMNDIVSPEHRKAAELFKRYYTTYTQAQDMINIGAYKSGANLQIDQSIQLYPYLIDFLQQDYASIASFKESESELYELIQKSMENRE